MTEYETYRQQFINKADQDDEGYVRNRFDAMELAFDFGYQEGQESAFRKVYEYFKNKEQEPSLAGDFLAYIGGKSADDMLENKSKILSRE